MKINLRRILLWTPRALSILFALFLSLFALDVFGAGYSFWETLLAFLIHLLPVYVLVIGLALAWKWKWVGALVFIGFALWYLVENWTPAALIADMIIAGPPMLIGILFLINWFYELQYKSKLAHS